MESGQQSCVGAATTILQAVQIVKKKRTPEYLIYSYLWRLYKQIFTAFQVPSITDLLAMSTTPSNNERSPRKWLKQKIRSVFSSSRSPSRNLEVRSTSTNVPPINSPSDGPRIIADRTESGKKIGFNHDPKVLTHFIRRTI